MNAVELGAGLGHSASRQAIVDYDSSISAYRSSHEVQIPQGFCADFTTLMYDYNDLQEEFTSARGTTHCTTGIIVQRTSLLQSDQSERHFIANSDVKLFTYLNSNFIT